MLTCAGHLPVLHAHTTCDTDTDCSFHALPTRRTAGLTLYRSAHRRVCAYMLGSSPSSFHLLYSLLGSSLMAVRYATYRSRKWHYYLFDFCYYRWVCGTSRSVCRTSCCGSSAHIVGTGYWARGIKIRFVGHGRDSRRMVCGRAPVRAALLPAWSGALLRGAPERPRLMAMPSYLLVINITLNC